MYWWPTNGPATVDDPPTVVTTTSCQPPGVSPGTVATTAVFDQLATSAATPPTVTVPLLPKPVPVTVNVSPLATNSGDTLRALGVAGAVGPPGPPHEASAKARLARRSVRRDNRMGASSGFARE